jgi:hypothetical protein
VCGSEDADGNTVLGALVLNENSVTDKAYGTKTRKHEIMLVYDVTGCTLRPATRIGAGNVSIMPAKVGNDLPGNPAVTVTAAKTASTAVAATIALDLGDIDPGSHGGTVRIHSPRALRDTFTPITVSRTNGLWWPILFGLAGSVAGLAWALGLHAARHVRLRFEGPLQWSLLFGLALGAGIAAGYGYWDNQEVWTVGDNAWATMTVGFTASTAGALAGVTAALAGTGGSVADREGVDRKEVPAGRPGV